MDIMNGKPSFLLYDYPYRRIVGGIAQFWPWTVRQHAIG